VCEFGVVLLDLNQKNWFLYPVCGANRSKHIFEFVTAGLSLSHLPGSTPCFLADFSLFAGRSVHGSLLPRALDFCRPCLTVGLQSPVGSLLLEVQALGTTFRSRFSLVPSLAARARPGFGLSLTAPLLRDSSSVHLVSSAAGAGLIYFLLLPSKACGLI
jgi:hypothetical protein